MHGALQNNRTAAAERQLSDDRRQRQEDDLLDPVEPYPCLTRTLTLELASGLEIGQRHADALRALAAPGELRNSLAGRNTLSLHCQVQLELPRGESSTPAAAGNYSTVALTIFERLLSTPLVV